MLALLGQQMGLVVKAFTNSTPASAMIFLAATMGSVLPMVTSWSSVRTRTMFGLVTAVILTVRQRLRPNRNLSILNISRFVTPGPVRQLPTLDWTGPTYV